MSRFVTLFRKIMKEHQRLPIKMKIIGDQYVRHEFKEHMKPETKPEHLQQFYLGWEQYLDTLRKSGGTRKFGMPLDKTTERSLNNDQMSKLKDFKSELDSLPQS